MTTTKPPAWFWIVAIVLLLWGAMGVATFYLSLQMSPAALAAMTEYDRQLYTERATWFIVTYGVAVWGALIGTLLLLLRRAWARPVYILSLIAVVVMFGWMFLATDIIAVKGVLVATGFPILIAVIGAFQIWFAGLAQRRGWIG